MSKIDPPSSFKPLAQAMAEALEPLINGPVTSPDDLPEPSPGAISSAIPSKKWQKVYHHVPGLPMKVSWDLIPLVNPDIYKSIWYPFANMLQGDPITLESADDPATEPQEPLPMPSLPKPEADKPYQTIEEHINVKCVGSGTATASKHVEFMANKNIMKHRIEVGMLIHMGGGSYARADTINFSDYANVPGEGDFDKQPPFLSLKHDEAVALMTELWHCGIRPADFGGESEMEAIKAHLEDMRTICFDLIGLKK